MILIVNRTRVAVGMAVLVLTLAGKALGGDEPSPARVQEIAGWLPAQATGLGQPITERSAWAALSAQHPEWRKITAQAEQLAALPIPPERDDLFLEFTRNGNRNRWQNAEYPRRDRIKIFALAECLEDRGRFLAPLAAAVAAICAEPTWVLSAHDGQLKNFHGQASEIDLGTAMVGSDLATVDWLLRARLTPATRALIHKNLEHRLFAPYRAAVAGKTKPFWWMHGDNNWNAVCLDGVTSAALATLEAKTERAWYIAVAERNVNYYLSGFTPDGYCVEGLGYWNYGFGNFTVLAENLREATGGRVDWLARPAVAELALFGARAEILNGIYPSIADCHPGGKPSGELMSFLNRRYGWGLAQWSEAKLDGTLMEEMALAFQPADLPVTQVRNNLEELPWRTCYPLGGVFTLRPGPGAVTPFAVCVKGGNNGVSHGHNDVGSFSVVAGPAMVVCDPGGEEYTKRTFSAHRYDSEVLNSFGHAVPVIGGELQRTGSAAQAVLLATNYTAAADTLTFDLRSAYPVKGLQQLARTFVYERGAHPGLTVRDEFAATQAQTFETALVTWGKVRQTGANEWELRDEGGAVRVQVDTGGQPFHVTAQEIHEDTENHRLPVHLGAVLDQPVRTATVTLHITPLPEE